MSARTRTDIAGADPDEVVALGPTLPTEEDSRLAEVFVFHPKGATSINWVLSLHPAPDEAPPGDIEKGDKDLGGRSGLALLLSEAVSASEVLCRYTVTQCLKASEWSCLVLPRAVVDHDVDAVIRKLDPSARIERIGYRFSERTDGILEVSITYLHERGCFHVMMIAVGPLVFADKVWLSHAKDNFMTICQALFEHSGGGTDEQK